MALAGKIKCDFCTFIGDLAENKLNKAALRIPDGWVSIHPTVVVHGLRGGKIPKDSKDRRHLIVGKVKQKVTTLHVCPACVSDRDVFDIGLCLGAPPKKEEREANPMKM